MHRMLSTKKRAELAEASLNLAHSAWTVSADLSSQVMARQNITMVELLVRLSKSPASCV